MAISSFWDKWNAANWGALIADPIAKALWLALTQAQRDYIKQRLFDETGRAAVGNRFGAGGLAELWKTNPNAPAMDLPAAIARMLAKGLNFYLAGYGGAAPAGASGMAARWAAAVPLLGQADFSPFGGAAQWPTLPGFPVDASIPALPGHKAVFLGGAASGIDNKDDIIRALVAAGALYDPAKADPYSRVWYVEDAKAGSIPKPLNRDNKAGGLGEKLVIGALGAIAVAGIVAAASGTALAAPASGAATVTPAGWNPIVDVVADTATSAVTTTTTNAAAQTIGETIVDDLISYQPSAFDLTGLTDPAILLDPAVDVAAGDWLHLNTVQSLFDTVATGTGAAAAGNAAGGLDFGNAAGSIIKGGASLISSLGAAFGAVKNPSTTGTTNPVGTVGRMNVGSLVLIGAAVLLLPRFLKG